MPSLPPKRCGSPGCKEFVPPFTKYCESHQSKMWKKIDCNRGGKDKFYDSRAWRNVRDYVLARNPLCAHCLGTEASLVDHIIPRQRGGADLELDNLQALCPACHNQKTARERR